MFKWKFLAVYSTILILVTSLSTLHIHNKFLDADKLKTTEMQLDNAQKAPPKLVKFTQDLSKTNAKKDPCFNTNIPTDTLKLLK